MVYGRNICRLRCVLGNRRATRKRQRTVQYWHTDPPQGVAPTAPTLAMGPGQWWQQWKQQTSLEVRVKADRISCLDVAGVSMVLEAVTSASGIGMVSGAIISVSGMGMAWGTGPSFPVVGISLLTLLAITSTGLSSSSILLLLAVVGSIESPLFSLGQHSGHSPQPNSWGGPQVDPDRSLSGSPRFVYSGLANTWKSLLYPSGEFRCDSLWCQHLLAVLCSR